MFITLNHIPSLRRVSRRITAASASASCTFLLLTLSSCSIKDDIPYPLLEAAITAFQVEGQCNETDTETAAATINKNDQTVELFVSDTVNLARVRVLNMSVTNDATINPSSACLNPSSFPKKSFEAPANATATLMNFAGGTAKFRLTTYQDYEWTINVRQVIIPKVTFEGQVGDAVIDATNHNIIVYMSAGQNLSAVRVMEFRPAGQHCRVTPDPAATPTYDFSQMRTFTVQPGNGTAAATWQVFVYHTEATQQATAQVFARSVSATISGQGISGTTPKVELRRQGETQWTQVPDAQVAVNGSRFTAEATGLTPGQTYEYQVTAGTSATSVQTFTTVAAQQLENASFDRWHVTGSSKNALYLPWGEGDTPYWDTGNHGATTVGASNSTYETEGSRTYANLQSKYIVIKFAAGNIFTGEYVETDGTNGVLNFGRPFNAFPTKMRFDFRYKTSTITRTAGDWKEAYGDYISRQLYEGLKGKPDSCNVYVALGDWPKTDYKGKTCNYLIRTRASALHLMDMKSPNLIAFGQMTCGDDVTQWKTETIDIDYRVRDRQPTTIIVVASSSKYGDYFTGGEGSQLNVDNIELLYE